MQGAHTDKPDGGRGIREGMDALLDRLARLHVSDEAAFGPAAALFDAVATDPTGTQIYVLERLAAFAGEGDNGLREAFIKLARELNDRLPDADDGYPPIEAESSSEGSDYEPSSSASDTSDTADADRLSDEDAEDMLHETNGSGEELFGGHDERKELRASVRAGPPEWFTADLAEWKEENDDPQWWSGEESEGQALAREAECERVEETEFLHTRLEYAEYDLENCGLAPEPDDDGDSGDGGDGDSGDGGDGDGGDGGSVDSLDELVGFVVEAPPETAVAGRAKRPRRESPGATTELTEGEAVGRLAKIEARLEQYEALEERRAAARDELHALLRAHCELTGEGLDYEDFGTCADMRPARGSPGCHAREAGVLLSTLELEPEKADLGAVRDCAARLRSRLDDLTEVRPALKRKRADLEAIDEIYAEQHSTEPVIGAGAFGRVVREIGQDFREGFRIDAGGLAALQAAAEEYIVGLMRSGVSAAAHAGRTHLAPEDLDLARELRGERR